MATKLAMSDVEWEEAGQLWATLIAEYGEQAGVILARVYLDTEKEAALASRGFGRLKPDAD